MAWYVIITSVCGGPSGCPLSSRGSKEWKSGQMAKLCGHCLNLLSHLKASLTFFFSKLDYYLGTKKKAKTKGKNNIDMNCAIDLNINRHHEAPGWGGGQLLLWLQYLTQASFSTGKVLAQ